MRNDIIWQDKGYTSGINEYSLKTEIISIFSSRGYDPLESEVIAFWKGKGNEEINSDIRDGIVNYRIPILDGAIARSILKDPHTLYRGLGNIESGIVRKLGKRDFYVP